MKRICYLVLFCLGLVLSVITSCTKEFPDSLIVGRWALVSDETSYYENDKLVDTEGYLYDENEAVLSFEKDGTLKIYEEGELLGTGTYKKDGGKLTISAKDQGFESSVSFDIEELTSTTLILALTYTEGRETVVSKMNLEKRK